MEEKERERGGGGGGLLEMTSINECVVDCLNGLECIFFSVVGHICTHTRSLQGNQEE